MKIVVGLGNPGERYSNTRHNAGFWCAEAMRLHLGLPAWTVMKKTQSLISKSSDWLLIEPQTFMNQSGLAVRGVLDYYLKFGQLSAAEKLLLFANIYVAHDDLDLVLGSAKVHFGRGPKVHNGLTSLNEHLGTDQYWHVRLGVDGRDPQHRMAGRDYVLEDFLPAEHEVMRTAIAAVLPKITLVQGKK